MNDWAPKHDHPVSKKKWECLASELQKYGFRVADIGGSGQGLYSCANKVFLAKNSIEIHMA